MSKIAITDYFTKPEEEQDVLGDLVGVDIEENTEVLLVWHAHINEKTIGHLPKLKGIQRYGVGYDTLDLEYLNKKGIIACNNPDYGTDEVSDTTISMILNIARGVSQYNFLAKNYTDSWQENINNKLRRLSDITVGVIGAGRIGGSVLLKCNALKFNTVFYDPYKERGYEKMLGSQRLDSMNELLNRSDIVSIHTPLSSATKGIINQTFLNQMKDGAAIVNSARGGLFADLDLLYDSLKNGKLAHLAIDVLPEEPPSSGPLIDAWRDPHNELQGRLIINPHTSYYSQQSYKELRVNAAKNALRMFNGEPPFNVLTQ